MDEQVLFEADHCEPKNIWRQADYSRELAGEHILGMLAAGDTVETILQGYPWLEKEDIQACLVHPRR